MIWLKAIKDYLAANVEIAAADLIRISPLANGAALSQHAGYLVWS